MCVDSDGCTMDTMRIKHTRCFGPCLVREWQLQEWEQDILDRWNQINLYSITRGVNRFRGLLIMLGEIHEKYRTPAHSNLLFMVIVSVMAAFIPARVAGEMVSIGTLFAFTLVCAGILIVRKSMPNVERAFKTPFVPLVPILGILTCLCMMVFLPADTWIRLVLWMLIGLDIYAVYGVKHSLLEHNVPRRKGMTVLNAMGIGLSVLAVITGLWHQQTAGWDSDKTLLVISFVFAFTHCGWYVWRMWKQTRVKA